MRVVVREAAEIQGNAVGSAVRAMSKGGGHTVMVTTHSLSRE